MRRLVLGLLAALLMASPVTGQLSDAPISSAGTAVVPSMTVQDTVFVANGRQFNLWNKALDSSLADYWAPFVFSYNSDVGTMTDRGFRWEDSVVRSDALGVTAVDRRGVPLKSDAFVLRGVGTDAGGEECDLQVLIFGDSLIDGVNGASSIVNELETLFADAPPLDAVYCQPTFLGDENTVSATAQHEAHSGMTWSWFAGGNSPFHSGVELDFQWYMAQISATGDIDVMIVQLGINDIFGGVGAATMTAAQLAQVQVYSDMIIDAALDASTGYPNCKIIISLAPTGAAHLSAAGSDYDASDTWYFYEKNMKMYNAAMLARYDGGAYDANVDICNASLWVDRDYSYTFTTPVVSSRTGQPDGDAGTSNTAAYYSGGLVHPNIDGSEQIADAWYCQLLWEMMDRPNDNLITQPSDFTSVWTSVGSPVRGTDTESPFGDDWQVWSNVNGSSGYFYQTGIGPALTEDTQFVMSCFLHYEGAGAKVRLQATPSAAGGRSIDLNLNSATDVSLSWAMPWPIDEWGFTPYKNGWVRVWFYDDGAGTDGSTFTPAVYLNVGSDAAVYTAGIGGMMLELDVTSPSFFDQTASKNE